MIRFNEGGTYNGKLFPKCKVSAVLNKGPSGCPKGSKIGKGTATAAAQPVIPLVKADLHLFNGEPKGGVPTVIIYAVPDISSPLAITGTSRGRRSPAAAVESATTCSRSTCRTSRHFPANRTWQ